MKYFSEQMVGISIFKINAVLPNSIILVGNNSRRVKSGEVVCGFCCKYFDNVFVTPFIEGRDLNGYSKTGFQLRT